jgi:hypothetical protein
MTLSKEEFRDKLLVLEVRIRKGTNLINESMGELRLLSILLDKSIVGGKKK